MLRRYVTTTILAIMMLSAAFFMPYSKQEELRGEEAQNCDIILDEGEVLPFEDGIELPLYRPGESGWEFKHPLFNPPAKYVELIAFGPSEGKPHVID